MSGKKWYRSSFAITHIRISGTRGHKWGWNSFNTHISRLLMLRIWTFTEVLHFTQSLRNWELTYNRLKKEDIIIWLQVSQLKLMNAKANGLCKEAKETLQSRLYVHVRTANSKLRHDTPLFLLPPFLLPTLITKLGRHREKWQDIKPLITKSNANVREKHLN
jgi:hypothetical protein